MCRMLLMIALLTCSSSFLLAQTTITVNTLADENGTGADCSLREALVAATSDSPFSGCAAGGLFETIEFSVSGTLTLTLGELVISNTNTTIEGGNNTVVAAPSSRIFRLTSGGYLMVKDLTMTGADVGSLGWPNGAGGAIFAENAATGLYVLRCTLTNNKSYAGGAIYTNVFTEVKDSNVSNNEALFGGGGITSGNVLDIERSTISDNTAMDDAGGGLKLGLGGKLVNSTLSGNSNSIASGLLFGNAGGTYTIENSTISGNTGAPAIENFANGGELVIRNSTITANSTDHLAGGMSIATTQGQPPPVTRVYSSIIAGNSTSSSCACPDVFGATYASGGYNIIGDATASTGFANGVNNDQVGVSPILLAPLANNGGSTFTHALLAGSPAIDLGDCVSSTYPNHDQRN